MNKAIEFCGHCGSPLDEGAAFCGECGRPVDKMMPGRWPASRIRVLESLRPHQR